MRPVSLVKVATDPRNQRALAPPFVVHQGPRTRGSHKEKVRKPTIVMDCKELGKAEDCKDKIKTIVVKDEDSGCVTAHVVEQIASADQ